MGAMRHNVRVVAILGTVSMLLILSACYPPTESPSTAERLLVTPTQTGATCEMCDQEQYYVDNQAVATAEIMGDAAQATLNSVNATLSAAQIQEQSNANFIAAQIAATAEIVRANAQATLVAADSTQSAALTQDVIQQTQVQYSLQVDADMATQNAIAMVTQQNRNFLAANTQTAIANYIATQTQSAVETTQLYIDETHQLEEQRRGPITFLWMWCLPIFIVLLASLVLWGFWRWLKIQQANQYVLKNPVDKSQAPMIEIIHHQQDDTLPYLGSGDVDSRYPLTKPDDHQVSRWLDEVKHKLVGSDKEDEDDNTDD
jgi:hypothetical protein